MKRYLLSLLIIGMMTAAACKTGSSDPLGTTTNNQNGNNGPTATPTPLPPISLGGGTWFGLPLTAETSANANYNSATGQLTQTCPTPPCTNYASWAYLKLTTCQLGTACSAVQAANIPVGYIVAGKIEFDLQMDVAPSLVGGAQIYWGNPSCYAYATFIPASALSFGTPTHYAIFLHDMTLTTGCSAPHKYVPFQISISHTGSSNPTPLAFTITNITWD